MGVYVRWATLAASWGEWTSRLSNRTLIAGPADGVDGPASLAFGQHRSVRKALFFTNFAYFTQAYPSVMKMELGFPGQ